MSIEQDQLAHLAASVDCITEHELLLLADIKPVTADAWRRRGMGPAYILIGNRYLYPRKAVAEYLGTLVRERRTAVKGAL